MEVYTVNKIVFFPLILGTLINAQSYGTNETTLAPVVLDKGLNGARGSLAVANIRDCSIFAGGYGKVAENTVDIFKEQNGQIIKINSQGQEITSTAESGLTLSIPRHNLSAISIDDYALFVGGTGYDGVCLDAVDVFKWQNGQIVKDNTQLNLTIGRKYLAATRIGDYVIFAGGLDDNCNGRNTVDVFKLNRNTVTIIKVDKDGLPITNENSDSKLTLKTARGYLAAISIGNYAIFAGGYDDQGAVDIFKLENDRIVKVDTSLTLSKARYALAATTIGKYAIFAGGCNDAEGDQNIIDIFELDGDKIVKVDTSLTLDIARANLSATAVGKYAIFAGGSAENAAAGRAIDIFTVDNGQVAKVDMNLNLNEERYNLAATSVRHSALFAGGINQKVKSVVEMIQLNRPVND